MSDAGSTHPDAFESGRFASAREGVRAGLRLLEDGESKLGALRRMLTEAGEVQSLNNIVCETAIHCGRVMNPSLAMPARLTAAMTWATRPYLTFSSAWSWTLMSGVAARMPFSSFSRISK